MNEESFQAGQEAAFTKQFLDSYTLRKVRTDKDYWEGFHQARPMALVRFEVNRLEDPTRSGGWCVQPD